MSVFIYVDDDRDIVEYMGPRYLRVSGVDYRLTHAQTIQLIDLLRHPEMALKTGGVQVGTLRVKVRDLALREECLYLNNPEGGGCYLPFTKALELACILELHAGVDGDPLPAYAEHSTTTASPDELIAEARKKVRELKYGDEGTVTEILDMARFFRGN